MNGSRRVQRRGDLLACVSPIGHQSFGPLARRVAEADPQGDGFTLPGMQTNRQPLMPTQQIGPAAKECQQTEIARGILQSLGKVRILADGCKRHLHVSHESRVCREDRVRGS